jgi:hypothetical protein
LIGVFCLHILLGAVGFVATAAVFADILDDSCNLCLVAALRVNLPENGGAHGEELSLLIEIRHVLPDGGFGAGDAVHGFFLESLEDFPGRSSISVAAGKRLSRGARVGYVLGVKVPGFMYRWKGKPLLLIVLPTGGGSRLVAASAQEIERFVW